ncbi:MAG: tRNA (N(6)-L-threonylcarbamoyladenosine(37)-C(2))-methylthiotransferase MtaB [Desulfuromonadaceae bacterium]|nr:tRNA (N(6)-L-threonylcarbamoyladenosine(37)-C(2))-methylthiotransferase MtaB [Desulfuromonadaceae bacterium]
MDRLGKTVALVTLGCKTNQFETNLMEERLRSAGFAVVPFDAGADLVVVNTCTVTAATDAQSRNLVRRSRRLNPACRIVVTGCYAQVRPQSFQNLPGVLLVLGNEEKNAILDHLAEPGEGARIRVSDIRNDCSLFTLCSHPVTGRSRAYLQIQNGCDAFCSYCIIPYARGRSRSLAVERALVEAGNLAERGFAEIILTGIHIGCYGRDLTPQLSLFDLVRRMVEETQVPRIRLGSIEPQEIPISLIDAMAASERICPHFHIPLQSGDNAVLKRMGRPYEREFFHELVTRIQATVADVAIGLDVIAGFPGESEREFHNTYDLIESLPVSYLHVFPFSRRPETPAASMKDQLPPLLIRERAALLRRLGESKREGFMRRFKGRRLKVVVEGERKGELHRGLSENFLPVYFRCDDRREKEIVTVEILREAEQGLIGNVVSSG